MRLSRYAVLILAGLSATPGGVNAPAQAQERPCHIARVHPLGVLEQCDQEFRSRTIEMEDIRRVLTIEPGGVFYFACPVEGLCADDPQISGWMINAPRWQQSPHDEETIFTIFRNVPGARGPWSNNSALSIARPDSRCGLFDLTVAGLPGNGVCYRSDDETSSAVVVVVSDATLGYVLIFHQQDVDSSALKERVLTLVPRFKIQVAKGDFGMAKWFR